MFYLKVIPNVSVGASDVSDRLRAVHLWSDHSGRMLITGLTFMETCVFRDIISRFC